MSNMQAEIKSLYKSIRFNEVTQSMEIDGSTANRSELSPLYLAYGKVKVDSAVAEIAGENSFNPIVDYLSLQWDGVPRIGKLLDCFAGENREGVTRWMCQCVERARYNKPSKILIIQGEQGIGKSSLIRWMMSGVGYHYYLEGSASSRDFSLNVASKWIWEIYDFSGHNIDKLIDAVRCSQVIYRPAYQRYELVRPSLCNIVYTTTESNSNAIRNAKSKPSAFEIVTLSKIDPSYASLDINQVWAEVAQLL